MKKLLPCFLAVSLLLSPLHASAEEELLPPQEWLAIMLQAAECGDLDAGRAAAICRNEALDARESLDARIDFDELLLLSKLIAWVADSDRIGLDWRICIGEIALNRVASPEYPDTLEEVVFQEGAYPGVDSEDFRTLFDPDSESVNAALALLRGERRLSPWVVCQSRYSLGSRDYARYCDEEWGVMYFCSSAHPEKYW